LAGAGAAGSRRDSPDNGLVEGPARFFFTRFGDLNWTQFSAFC
jgi:hypothetical protein